MSARNLLSDYHSILVDCSLLLLLLIILLLFLSSLLALLLQLLQPSLLLALQPVLDELEGGLARLTDKEIGILQEMLDA